MEGKLVAEILTRIGEADGLDQPVTLQLRQSVSLLEQIVDGLGFCLSEEGDLLSQWRGYAADATGVSIGFADDYLRWFAESSRGREKPGFALKKVAYEADGQEALLKPTYTEIRKLIDEGALKSRGKRTLLDSRSEDEIKRDDEKIKTAFAQLSLEVLMLLENLFLLKTSAFREEREWRLISYFVKSGNDPCLFRALDDRIVPYREFKLLEAEKGSIVKVILGPKNTTPNYVIDSFLKQRGFRNVTISRSEATYR